MSSAAKQSVRLKNLYASGRCVSCTSPHTDVSKVTQRPSWRCAACRAKFLAQKALRAERAEKGVQKCDCGRPIRRNGALACVWCETGRMPRAVGRKPQAHRHIPSTLYTQSRAIEASYFWRQAVSR